MHLFSFLEAQVVNKDDYGVLTNKLQALGYTSSESVRDMIYKELFPELGNAPQYFACETHVAQ